MNLEELIQRFRAFADARDWGQYPKKTRTANRPGRVRLNVDGR